MGDEAILAAILEDLDGTFPGAPGKATETYVDGVVQNWGTAPYTLGVYSYPKVETYTSATDNLREDLQAAVAESRVFFAGEATSVARSATVPGALQEGERAADAVQDVNGDPGNPPDLPK